MNFKLLTMLGAVIFVSRMIPACADQTVTTTNRFESFVNQTKNPVDWLSWGADLRVRNEYLLNANMQLNPAANEINQLRTRVRIWTTLKPVDNFELNGRLTWESRYFSRPDEPVPMGSFLLDSFEHDEVICDNLNFRFTQLFHEPVTLTVGRQDLFLGNGWIFGDGTSRDGSRTYFLDAARLTFEYKPWQTTFNVIGIDQSAQPGGWLPPIDQQDFREFLTEQNEHALVLYAINKAIPETQVDGYFIYEQSDRVSGVGGSVDGQVFAFGARVAANLSEHWKLRSECLPEFGHKNGQHLEAFGANNRLSYYFLDPLNNNLRIGYEYLSGNKPGTPNQNERFDPLWGRWPQFSELLVYNPTVGPRPVEWGNFHRLNCGWSFNPVKKMEFSADYHALFAVENEPFTFAGTTYQTTGHFRGHLATTQLEYVFNTHLKGHLRGEWFFPGDYYDTVPSGPQKDMELFLRAEVLVSW